MVRSLVRMIIWSHHEALNHIGRTLVNLIFEEGDQILSDTCMNFTALYHMYKWIYIEK